MPENDVLMTRPTAMAPDASTSPVDWSRPIEAVHTSGAVQPAVIEDEPQCDGDSVGVRRFDGSYMHVNQYGEYWGKGHLDGWRIRNVQPTTPELDPMRERLEALARALADVPLDSVLGQSGYASEARAIVADLPKPVDPDLRAAREVAADYMTGRDDGLNAGWADAMIAGQMDDGNMVGIALAAIKRGRELAGEQA